jgi:hypothetical protein
MALSKLRHPHPRHFPIIQFLPSLVLEPKKEETKHHLRANSALNSRNRKQFKASTLEQTENEKFGRAWTLGKEGLKLMYARMLQWKVN